jgi:hypothetical protein
VGPVNQRLAFVYALNDYVDGIFAKGFIWIPSDKLCKNGGDQVNL